MLAVCLACGAAGLAAWLVGCAANGPFDPDSVPNQAPLVKFFVGPVEPGGDLNATSYFRRTFRWSGTDPDGWVTEYRVSIRSKKDEPAPWITTTSTDTTMTFTTGEDGTSEATFYISCRDDRGALSDTLVQFVPLRNFPPVVNFQSDFDPLVNLQREITTDGAVTDTTYWSWGISNFRFFALDLDGASTMDDTFLFTVADGDPTEVVDEGDPAADPNDVWVRAPFLETTAEVREFEVQLRGVRPGLHTLRVKVGDEAGGEALFSYDLDVRSPRGRVLYVFDNTSSIGRTFYRSFLDEHYGAGNWDTYDFWFGFPDRAFVLLETMRLFDAVIWTGGANSNTLVTAAKRDGAIQQFIAGTDGADPGKFLLVTNAVAGGDSDLPLVFIQSVLGISPTPAPPSAFANVTGNQALGETPELPAMTVASGAMKGLGIVPLDGAEALYRMEYCQGCYGDPRRPRPPFDPVVVVRKPVRSESTPLADVISISLQLEYFDQDEAKAVLSALVDDELGVGP